MNKKTLSILVVDDDSITRFIHKKVIGSLIQFNIIYYEAANGLEAIRLLENMVLSGKQLPELILLDINMPVLNGFGFIDIFQRLNLPGKERIQIVIVSSSENHNDIKRSYELGIDLYFPKPITKENLETTIQEYLALAA